MMMFKKISSFLIALLFLTISYGQEQKFQLSSHILDVSKGQPAPNVKIKLEKQTQKGDWEFVAENTTDKDGRVKDLLPYSEQDNSGVYKLIYYTKPYFEILEQDSFYPFIEVVFEIKDKAHYHVPITLSPFGYSTYRGS